MWAGVGCCLGCFEHCEPDLMVLNVPDVSGVSLFVRRCESYCGAIIYLVYQSRGDFGLGIFVVAFKGAPIYSLQ